MKALLPACFGILLAGILLAGCGGSSDPGAETRPDDPYEGIAEWETELLLEINDSTSTDDELFFPSGNFHDMEIGPDGSLFIQNRGLRTIFQLSAEGEYLGSIGQEGEGPGEFQIWPTFDTASSDSLFVLDDRKDEVMLFVHRGGSWTYKNGFLLEQVDGFEPRALHYLGRGRLAVIYEPFGRNMLVATEQDTQFTRRVDLFGADGEVLRPAWISVPANEYFIHREPSGAGVIIPLAYGNRSYLDSGPDGLLYHAWSRDFRIHMYRPGQQETDSIFHGTYRPAVSEELRQQEIDDYSGASFGSRSYQEAMLDAYKAAIPEEAPTLRDMHVDRDNGRIIVRRYVFEENEPNWMLLDADGTRLATFRLPENLEVYDFRYGTILGAVSGDEMLPTVRAISIESPTSSVQ